MTIPHQPSQTMSNQPDELDKIMWNLGAAIEEGRYHDADLRKTKAAIRAYVVRQVREAQDSIINFMEYLSTGTLEERRAKLKTAQEWNDKRKAQLAKEQP